MKLIEVIEAKNEALRVRDIARILGVSAQQIYKMAAKGQIPSFRVANAVRSTHRYSRRGLGRNILLSMSRPFREL